MKKTLKLFYVIISLIVFVECVFLTNAGVTALLLSVIFGLVVFIFGFLLAYSFIKFIKIVPGRLYEIFGNILLKFGNALSMFFVVFSTIIVLLKNNNELWFNVSQSLDVLIHPGLFFVGFGVAFAMSLK